MPKRMGNKFRKTDRKYGIVLAWLRHCDELPSKEEWEWLRIDEGLRRTGGNLAWAAELLGMTREGLSRKLKRRSTRTRGA